jgi:hypothetical protein
MTRDMRPHTAVIRVYDEPLLEHRLRRLTLPLKGLMATSRYKLVACATDRLLALGSFTDCSMRFAVRAY